MLLLFLFIMNCMCLNMTMIIVPNVPVSNSQNIFSRLCITLSDCYSLIPLSISGNFFITSNNRTNEHNKYYLYVSTYEFNYYDSKYELLNNKINMYVMPLLVCQDYGNVCMWFLQFTFFVNDSLHDDTIILYLNNLKICNLQNTYCMHFL